MRDLSTREVCERLGIDRSTLQRWEERGYLRSWQIGTGITCPKRWALEEIQRFEKSWKNKKAVKKPR